MNALEVPDIIYQVALHFPAWTYTSTYIPDKKEKWWFPVNYITMKDEYEFHAQDLLACTQVSWLWRWVTLPLLWRCYTNRHEFSKNVTMTTLLKYRHLIRSLNVIDVDISCLSKAAQHDIWIENSRHRQETLAHTTRRKGGRMTRRTFLNIALPLFAQFTGLRIFRIEGYKQPKFSKMIGKILIANPHLDELVIRDCSGSGSFCGDKQFLSVTCLTLDSPRFLRLLRSCPNLRRFSFSTRAYAIGDILTALKEYCPRLDGLKAVGEKWMSTCIMRDDRHRCDTCSPPEAKLIELLQIRPYWRCYTMLMHDLTPAFAMALVQRSNHLTSLEIRLMSKDDKVALDVMCVIFNGCKLLEQLYLCNLAGDWSHSGTPVLFPGAWIAPSLRDLHVQGFRYLSNAPKMDTESCWDPNVWYHKIVPPVNQAQPTFSLQIKWLLSNTEKMPELRTFQIDCRRFFRIDNLD
ncbi:hypothetical protein BGZ94_001825 [Podila epigama]|nr:hypothetical protein BGZ94_001825 [Podila epigama]